MAVKTVTDDSFMERVKIEHAKTVIHCLFPFHCPPLRDQTETTMAYKQRDDEETMKCLECGHVFVGRPDKKFCSDRCRNHFHAKERSVQVRVRNNVFGKLISNYRILEELLKAQTTSIGLNEIEALGFNASFITGCRRGRHRHDEYRCFDIIYNQSDSKIFNIKYMTSLKP